MLFHKRSYIYSENSVRVYSMMKSDVIAVVAMLMMMMLLMMLTAYAKNNSSIFHSTYILPKRTHEKKNGNKDEHTERKEA